MKTYFNSITKVLFLLSGLVMAISCSDSEPGKTFSFYVAVYIPNGENIELTDATISIENNGSSVYSGSTGGEIKEVKVGESESEFTLEFSKPGYQTTSMILTQTELEAYDVESPLEVVLAPASLEDELVAYYPFSGDATDHSGNGLNGTVHGATSTTDRHGVEASAYFFDGDDYIAVADNSLLDFDNDDDFTISLWAAMESDQPSDGGINDIIRKWSGDTQGYPFGISFDNENAAVGYQKKFVAVRYDGSVCVHGPSVYSAVLNYTEFYYVTLVKSGSTISLYVNNELQSTVDDTTECGTTNTSQMTIGCRGQLARFFKGKIDDIRIYSRALGDEERTALYHE